MVRLGERHLFRRGVGAIRGCPCFAGIATKVDVHIFFKMLLEYDSIPGRPHRSEACLVIVLTDSLNRCLKAGSIILSIDIGAGHAPKRPNRGQLTSTLTPCYRVSVTGRQLEHRWPGLAITTSIASRQQGSLIDLQCLVAFLDLVPFALYE